MLTANNIFQGHLRALSSRRGFDPTDEPPWYHDLSDEAAVRVAVHGVGAYAELFCANEEDVELLVRPHERPDEYTAVVDGHTEWQAKERLEALNGGRRGRAR